MSPTSKETQDRYRSGKKVARRAAGLCWKSVAEITTKSAGRPSFSSSSLFPNSFCHSSSVHPVIIDSRCAGLRVGKASAPGASNFANGFCEDCRAVAARGKQAEQEICACERREHEQCQSGR